MALSHLSRLLVCATLLLAVRHISAGSIKGNPWDPIIQNTCPIMVRVGHGHGLTHVGLQETLEFDLNPNLPQMSMMFLQDDMLYKATVDGTMLKLFQCDERESNCTLLREGGTKDKDLLVVDEWNRILVKYINGVITVDVNMRSNVMGGRMEMTKEPSKSGGGHVTFLVPPATSFYSATLRILCSDGPPHIWTEPPPSSIPTAITTIAPSMPEIPYKKCPVYQVEVDHPSIPAYMGNELTLAVYPSHSALQIIIANDYLYLKVYVDGSRAKLMQCNITDQGCSSMDESRINEAFIVPGKWNFVTFSLFKSEIILCINERKPVLVASLQSTNYKGFKVSAMAPQGVSIGTREHFTAFINVKCEVMEQQTVRPTFPQEGLPTKATIVGSEKTVQPTYPQKGLPTKASIADSTPATPTISRNVGIIVGVLVGILLIIALAIIISMMKKRRLAAINEQTPLQNQQQSQD